MLLEIVLLLVAGAAFVYFRFQYKTTYWANMGVRQPEKTPFINGNNCASAPEVASKKVHLNDISVAQYREFRDVPFYGTYAFGVTPYRVLTVTDLDLIKNIYVKDFDHFVDRLTVGIRELGTSPTDEVWNRILLKLTGDEWRAVRAVFSPIFTSGKMKAMLHFMYATAGEMSAEVGRAASSNKEIDTKDLAGKFSMETIASCAFGVKAGSFNESDSRFRKCAQSVFTFDSRDALLAFSYLLPGVRQLFDWLRVPIYKPKETEFLVDSVKQTIKARMASNDKRNDLIDMMIAAMKDELECDQEEDKELQSPTMKLRRKDVTEQDIISTAVVILVAGFDTTGSTLSFLFYALAMNPDIQEKLQSEIDEAIQGSSGSEGKLAFAEIQEIEYLEKVILETLRRYPPVGVSFRECTEDYTFPGTQVKIRRGTEIQIPVLGIHMDERYFPEPERFDPERFTKEAKAARHPMAFMAFSHGPRMCLGMRFAMLEMKVAVVNVLRDYSVRACAETPTKVTWKPDAVTSTSLEPLLVKFEKRVKN